MDEFYCPKCQKIFEAKGEKREWESSIYGHCWKRIAKCPVCQTECDEYKPSFSSSKKISQIPTCSCGGGSCGPCGLRN